MRDVLFMHKPRELENLLTHAHVCFLSEPSKFEVDLSRSRFIAARLRGSALDWLTKKIAEDDTLLNDWPKFEQQLRATFLPAKEVRMRQAEQEVRKLRQKGSARAYAIYFDGLMAVLKYKDKPKQDAFIAGLKYELKKQLIGHNPKDYDELKAKAIEYDDYLYILEKVPRRQQGRRRI